MYVDPSLPFFVGVDDKFTSPFPSQLSFANPKFLALLNRPDGKDGTLRQAVLNQAGCLAMKSATQMLVRSTACYVGDFLPDLLPKIAYVTKSGAIHGIMGQAPFLLSTDPKVQLEAMAKVGMDIGLAAISAIPVAGWIVGIVGGIARTVAEIFMDAADNVPKSQAIRLPWDNYQGEVDEDLVDTVVNIQAQTTNWQEVFSPPTEAIPWRVAQGVDDKGNELGAIFAPVPKTIKGSFKNEVAYNGAHGVIPGSFRVAGVVQSLLPPQPTEDRLRFYGSGELIRWGDRLSNTGDFYPALQQVGGMMWQQLAVFGSPNLYKVNAQKLEAAWVAWFDALYGSAFALGVGDLLLPYLAHKKGAGAASSTVEYLIGVNAEGVLRPRADGIAVAGEGAELLERSELVPLVTPDVWATGLVAPSARTSCLFTEAGSPRYQTSYPTPHTRDKQGRLVAPSKPTSRAGDTCIPWPPGDLLLRQYERVDRAVTTPACRNIAKLQRDSLARSLVCAYVRIDEVDGRPAYPAFVNNPALHAKAVELRKRLLKHPSRMMIDFRTARDVDPQFAELLREAGVPTTQAQAASVGRQLAGSGARQPLDPDSDPPPRPDPIQGGLPFGPPARAGNGSSGAGLVLGGAAVGAALWKLLR